jgi:two-component system LytT family sensor kinase
MLDAIAFATGAALSAMLGLMQWRVDRPTGRPSGYLLLWALGFIWTFGNFLRGALALAGVGPDAGVMRFAESFAWSCTLLGPVAIARLLQGGIGTASRVSRGFLAFAIGVSLVNFGRLMYANQQYAYRLEDSWYPASTFYLGLVIGAAALLLYRVCRPRGPRAESGRRWLLPVALGFAAVHSSAILLSLLFPDMPAGLLTVATLIGQHWIIPWSVLIAVSLAQTHYADVVLKRSLWLLVSVSLATAASTMVLDERGLPMLAMTLIAAALMMAAPLCIRALDAFVDRAILKRPDYSLARSMLEESTRGATQPEQLVEAALDALRATLGVDARWAAVDASPAPSTSLAATPVTGGNLAPHRLEIIARHQARTLMQKELAFLDSVGKHLQSRLDAMHFEHEQRALHLREERLKRLLTEAELKALRTQVDPHFLFNTLNTIADLIRTNPGQAERMTERLAECFRYALAKHSRDLSTLDEELGFARQYLEIEQVRFGDRLRVELSRGDALGSEAMPSLLLQPLLENAIRHGLAPLREGGCVSVQARREGQRLHLRIEDDGVGLRPGFAEHAGIGLRNVQDRLRTLYAQAAEFLIGQRPGGRGTTVTIVIPLHAH